MNRKTLHLLTAMYISMGLQAQSYKDGVFLLNEDWYGHNNSTLNFIRPDNIDEPFLYYIIQNNNANNGQSLGCTSQFGTVYGDNLYVISKQDQDGGDKSGRRGGRVVVADAQTMEIKKRIPLIMVNGKGQSIADGRGFVGVDETKGYVGTSNGIYILDFNNFEITRQIEGTENPLITGDEINSDGVGPLYQNQIGMMLRSSDYVFAIQQDKGVLVINPETDKVEKIIEGCFSTMVQSKDGNIWVGRNTNMDYQKYPYGENGSSGECWEGTELLRIDPGTLETESIAITQGGINQTWYAWTAGSLCASTHEIVLYFTFYASKWSWFTTSQMYKFDINRRSFQLIYDSSEDGRYFYGAGIRINPLDDKLYGALYIDNNIQNYWVYQMSNTGEVLQEYEPIRRYWFPAMFIFPDIYAPEVKDFADITLKDEPVEIDLATMATDKDNLDIAITKKILSVSNNEIVTATIKNNRLKLTPLKKGSTDVTVRFNSNGKFVDKILHINSTTTGIMTKEADEIRVFEQNGQIHIEGLQKTSNVTIYNAQGLKVRSITIEPGESIDGLPGGQVYILNIDNQIYKVIY